MQIEKDAYNLYHYSHTLTALEVIVTRGIKSRIVVGCNTCVCYNQRVVTIWIPGMKKILESHVSTMERELK